MFIYKIKTEKIILQKEVDEQLRNLREKDTMLIQQSRLASMGEMIGNIAHQWRQPLNVLGIKNMALEMNYKAGKIDDKFIDDFIKDSSRTIQHMSDTIDDFRDFFKPDKQKEDFNIYNSINKSIEVVSDSFINYNIQCVVNGDHNIILNGYQNEFGQVMLNLLSNAKDAIKMNDIEDAKISIDMTQTKKVIIIEIKDNAGGIPVDIIDKVFDPYFTTKDKSQGTGVGLYMSKMIIENNMGGKLTVKNGDDGAIFTIAFKYKNIKDKKLC
ncbi:MAG: hypothetical protein DRG78_14115 [Epsilonproteobacteria bacterium]|nr:MAG: hypothetical protein DRG78_14115 [Campylobacterota bacterium]